MKNLNNCFNKRHTLLLSVTAAKLTGKRFFSVSYSPTDQSWLSVPGNPLIKWPPRPHPPQHQRDSDVVPQSPSPNLNPSPNPNPNYLENDFSTLCNLLRDPNIRAGPFLESALDQTGIEPELALLRAIFDHFDSSPRLLHTLFLWAEKKPGFQSSATLFNSMVNVLGKAREFDSAWCLVLERLGGDEGPAMVSRDTFAILIRRYTRAGNFIEFAPLNSTLELASSLIYIRGLLEYACYCSRPFKCAFSWEPARRFVS